MGASTCAVTPHQVMSIEGTKAEHKVKVGVQGGMYRAIVDKHGRAL